jgi:hypothetical protein
MKLHSLILGAATAVCATGLAFAPRASATVSDEDFNSLKSMVQQLNDSVQSLKQEHNQDQQTIQQLREQLGQTQTLATNAVQTAQAAQAQANKPPSGPFATHNFSMVGDAEVQYGKVDGSHSAFALADFAPIFLYRANDNILFEAGFDVILQNDTSSGHANGSSTSIGLSFAQLDYIYNDYVTVVAGDMLLPLGTYNERSAGWLTKIPDAPLLDDQILPSSGIGAQLRGAIPVGQSGESLTYAVYGANGPSSMDGSGSAGQLDLGGNVGINDNGSSGNLHSRPSGGGRIGWFYPWKPHYDLELGISGQTGEWDDAGNHLWSAAVLDAALHIGPNFEAKGEYANTWYGTDDSGTIHPHGLWVQAAYKLAGLNLDFPVVNNLELVGRFDNLNDGLGAKTDRYTLGYIYYFTNTLLFEGDYEILHSSDPGQNHNDFVLQLSYGF